MLKVVTCVLGLSLVGMAVETAVAAERDVTVAAERDVSMSNSRVARVKHRVYRERYSGCPDGYGCYPLYGAYGPYGGHAYWNSFSYIVPSYDPRP
jgi:hypothetical protein